MFESFETYDSLKDITDRLNGGFKAYRGTIHTEQADRANALRILSWQLDPAPLNDDDCALMGFKYINPADHSCGMYLGNLTWYQDDGVYLLDAKLEFITNTGALLLYLLMMRQSKQK